MSAAIYIAGKGYRTHIAAHKPSGYGVRALCGASWREGDYTVVPRQSHVEIIVCRSCANSRRWRPAAVAEPET